MILDNPDELFLLQEAGLWLLKDGQDEFEADDLRPDHVVTYLFVAFWLLLALYGELDD